MFQSLSKIVRTIAIFGALAVPAGAAVITSTIGEFDGPDSTGFTYPQPSLLIGTFTYTLPAGTITAATVSGYFGTSYAPSTALENLYLAGVQVASCASESAACWTAPFGVQTPWSYTFTSAQLSLLRSGSAAYTVVQTGGDFVESGVTTLSVTVVPEPATVAMLCGGLAILPFVRRKARQ